MRITEYTYWWLLAGLLFGVLVRGLFLVIMDVDASQYASIAMEMVQDNSWLQVKHRHADYLDKPPLLFWLSALSFELFGFSNWAYKLPSLLGGLLGIYAVFRFCKLYYPEKVALWAAFIMASGLGFVVISNDVRTDTLLLGTGAAAVWQLAEYLERKQWINLLAGFAFIGLAMTAKGPIGLIMPAFALGSHVLLRRDWKSLFDWRWLAGLVVTAVVLLPMCWGLYQQFDLQPEKVVHGKTGVSGLYFFFWEQSFGRITGENVWKNDASPFYFVHVYGWAFLPWVGLFYVFLIQKIIGLFRGRFKIGISEEGISLGGFLLTFIAMSLSQYKLPHYVFITLPWASVLTAAGLYRVMGQSEKNIKWPYVILYITGVLALGIVAAVVFWIFPLKSVLLWAVLLVLTGILFRAIWIKPFPLETGALVRRGVLIIGIFLVALNFHFYPSLLPYQSTSTLMERANSLGQDPEHRAWMVCHGHSLDFYSRHILPGLATPGDVLDFVAENEYCYLYTNKEGKSVLDEAGIEYKIDTTFGHFQVALLNGQFLNPDTRESALEPVWILQIGSLEKK